MRRRITKHQVGAASVEFVIMAVFMVPLILIVPLLGKYIDLAQTTTVASRYVAFEGTVHHGATGKGVSGWKTDEQLATEVRRRFYSRNDTGINTNDLAGEFDTDRNPLWVDHRGDHMLPKFSRVAVSTTRTSLKQPFGAALYAKGLGLDYNNLYTGRVGVNVAQVKDIGLAVDKSSGNGKAAKVFNSIDLQMNRHTVVLVDPWAALEPGDVKEKVEKSQVVLPTVHLDAFKLALTAPYGFIETLPSNGKNKLPEIGYVEPDIVPEDRLKEYKE